MRRDQVNDQNIYQRAKRSVLSIRVKIAQLFANPLSFKQTHDLSYFFLIGRKLESLSKQAVNLRHNFSPDHQNSISSSDTLVSSYLYRTTPETKLEKKKK